MKKLLALILALLMLSAPCAMAEAYELDEFERSPAEAYEFETTEEGLFVADLIFDKEVTVTGESGNVMFSNCVFNGDIVNKAGEGTKVMLLPGCEFGEGVTAVIDSALTEATVDTELPRFMVLCAPPQLRCGDTGAFVAFADAELEVNGVKYSIDDALYFYDEAKGQMGEYTGQEADMQNIAMWTEDGTAVFMHVAIKTAPEE